VSGTSLRVLAGPEGVNAVPRRGAVKGDVRAAPTHICGETPGRAVPNVRRQRDEHRSTAAPMGTDRHRSTEGEPWH